MSTKRALVTLFGLGANLGCSAPSSHTTDVTVVPPPALSASGARTAAEPEGPPHAELPWWDGADRIKLNFAERADGTNQIELVLQKGVAIEQVTKDWSFGSDANERRVTDGQLGSLPSKIVTLTSPSRDGRSDAHHALAGDWLVTLQVWHNRRTHPLFDTTPRTFSSTGQLPPRQPGVRAYRIGAFVFAVPLSYEAAFMRWSKEPEVFFGRWENDTCDNVWKSSIDASDRTRSIGNPPVIVHRMEPGSKASFGGRCFYILHVCGDDGCAIDHDPAVDLLMEAVRPR